MNVSPDHYRAQAQALAGSGDAAGALELLETALEQHRGDATLANSAGNLAMKLPDFQRAARLFGQAVELVPTSLEYIINLAIALCAADRHAEALAALEPLESAGMQDARYCSVRAGCARGMGDLAEAANWYDRSIALNPAGAKAVHGRARVALERGASDAMQLFERALSINRNDAEAWLGLAEALDAAGDSQRARELTEQLVQQAPQWIAALRLLAQIRLGAGEDDFTSHFAQAEERMPGDPAIAREHIRVLEQHDRFADALEKARNAARRFPQAETFALLEASYAGIIGEDAMARNLFDGLAIQNPDRWLLEARYLLGCHEYDRCGALLDKVIASDPLHISAWAVRDFLWRLTGDHRAEWLHGQPGLVQMVKLPDGEAVLRDAVPLLHRLHGNSAFPLGQSLRGGTQTRGNLFDRAEPEIAVLREAIVVALESYRDRLPNTDKAHPLLRHCDAPWTFAGSWSVRLDAGGHHHASHIHPQGIVSSALYCELPPDKGDGSDRNGWIELGRPPPEMRIELEPLHALEPRKGYLALFPSTLYHGTRPFDAGRRMTVAFDVVVETP